MPDVGYLEIVHDSEKLAPYFAELKNHPVVEIGPGNNPVTNYFPCKDYIRAEGHYPNDGVSVLRKLGDRSVVVVSVAVIDDAVLFGNAVTSSQKQLCARYIDELVQEIKRVTNPFSMILGKDSKKYVGKPDLEVVEFGGIYFFK